MGPPKGEASFAWILIPMQQSVSSSVCQQQSSEESCRSENDLKTRRSVRGVQDVDDLRLRSSALWLQHHNGMRVRTTGKIDAVSLCFDSRIRISSKLCMVAWVGSVVVRKGYGREGYRRHRACFFSCSCRAHVFEGPSERNQEKQRTRRSNYIHILSCVFDANVHIFILIDENLPTM